MKDKSSFWDRVLVCSSVITKYYNLGVLKRHVVLMVLEVGKSKIKVLANQVPGEDFTSALQMAIFLPCPHMASGERKPLSSSYKDANSIM